MSETNLAEKVEVESDVAGPGTVTVDFNLDRHLYPLITDAPFFAEISRHIRKVPNYNLPTAGVRFDKESDELVLEWNPKFFAGLTNMQVRNVLIHEFYHIVFCHISNRRKQPHMAWNIATDCAINSIIVSGAGAGKGDAETALPPGCVIPGHFPLMPDGRKPTKEEKEANALGGIIAGFKPMLASEQYFSELMKKAKEMMQESGSCGCNCHGEESGEKGDSDGPGQEGCEGGDKDGSGGGGGEKKQGCPKCGKGCGKGKGGGSFDDHDGWDGMPEDMREYVEARAKAIIEKAVKTADQSSTGWGNIPAEIREEIRRSVSTVVNWRAVLRQFVGTTIRGARTTSIKRISRRYPYIHPGLKRSYTAKLLVAIDQSGSVNDEWLCIFFAELANLAKKVDVSIIHFDTECAAPYEWKRGTKVEAKRTRCGGTDFDAPTRFVNDPKNRGRWDGLCVLTDGQAPAPGASRLKRAWVLAKGQKLYFDSNELQIFLDDNVQMKGVVR